MKNEISYEEALRKVLDFPNRKIFWRYGYAYRGASYQPLPEPKGDED